MTKAQIKLVQSLSRQKYRKEHNAYLVEGDKNVKEWLAADCTIQYVFGLPDWLRKHDKLLKIHPEAEINEVSGPELAKISTLVNPQDVLIVVKKPLVKPFDPKKGQWSVYLETIQDPGNMGTIIRTADWFGIPDILLSPDCVDIYNPKVVQATMGSLLRVNFSVVDLGDLKTVLAKSCLHLYAACLEGDNIFQLPLAEPGVIAMGNESAGLSASVLQLSDYKVTIPRIGRAESLNVGVAMGIIAASLVRSG